MSSGDEMDVDSASSSEENIENLENEEPMEVEQAVDSQRDNLEVNQQPMPCPSNRRFTPKRIRKLFGEVTNQVSKNRLAEREEKTKQRKYKRENAREKNRKKKSEGENMEKKRKCPKDARRC
ncbi:pre-mRNA-splicing factor CWC22 homolog [Parasteatoda tepidariorum]|uniref:pre-mRNA-splicing factor CWC22 homolog n=1 Tax=Parasteatoda tepidariorum TaxID=114398 RepID=UPI00077FAA7E|nr:uncharacterized protein LOC107450955 [Parasteatoda tepidariorum]XP_015922388.1 uncharacterized protein LOC107450955 [Parasteatoda tepidariorum]XP_015922389.1 uncharacterized protein LOC107450955 [Parasteatoda tepidariorum]XP_015922390.1 uncharacterized protein LOC107450955 [Parasteatoda tepidariorum]